MTFNSYITWVKAHERIIFLAVIAFLVYHGMTVWTEHDKRVQQVAQQQVQTDTTNFKAIVQQLAELTSTVAKQQQQLDASIKQRDDQTTKQQQSDDKMAPTDLAIRIAQLLKVQQQEVQASPVTGEVTFSADAAHTDADQLETIPALIQDKADLKTELAGEQSIVAKQGEDITAASKLLADTEAACQAQVNTLKVQNKTKFWSGFKWGIVVGAAGGEVLRVLIGRP